MSLGGFGNTQSLQPGLGLFGFAGRAWAGGSARGHELIMQRERLEIQSFPCFGDLFGEFCQCLNHRENERLRLTIPPVAEQSPMARRRFPQRGDQHILIFGFQFDSPFIKAFKAIGFGHRKALVTPPSRASTGAQKAKSELYRNGGGFSFHGQHDHSR